MSYNIKAALTEASILCNITENWQLDAELLLASSLDCNRTRLRSRPEQMLTHSQWLTFNTALKRRMQGEPVAYILGRKGFMDFELMVDARVLIPRPETELLALLALEILSGRKQEKLALADLGTGSGAIAIALARHCPNWHITALDNSADALAVARANVDILDADNIDLMLTDWCQQLRSNHFDMIVGNPPYIAPDDPHLLGEGLPFEPATALVAANDGLAALESIVNQAPRCLKPGGWLLVEHGYNQAKPVNEMLTQCGYSCVRCWQDLAGLDRVTAARIADGD